MCLPVRQLALLATVPRLLAPRTLQNPVPFAPGPSTLRLGLENRGRRGLDVFDIRGRLWARTGLDKQLHDLGMLVVGRDHQRWHTL